MLTRVDFCVAGPHLEQKDKPTPDFMNLLSNTSLDEVVAEQEFRKVFSARNASSPPLEFGNKETLLFMYSPDVLRAFFKVAKEFDYQCEKLDFTSTIFNDDTWRVLVENIHLIGGVKELKFAHLSDRFVPFLQIITQEFLANLTTFHISCQEDQDEHRDENFSLALMTTLHKMPILEELSLDQMFIADEDMSSILVILSFNNKESLKTLILSDNVLTSDFLDTIVMHFRYFSHLTSLDLSFNVISTLTQPFVDYMMQSNLIDVDISRNDIEQDVWDDIKPMFAEKTNTKKNFTLWIHPQESTYYQSFYRELNAFFEELNIKVGSFAQPILELLPPPVVPLDVLIGKPDDPSHLTQEWVDRVNAYLKGPSYLERRNEIIEWALNFQYRILNVPFDGNCLFSSAAKQCGGIPPDLLRCLVIYHMLVNQLKYEHVCIDQPFSVYLAMMARDKTWGTQLEMNALGDMLGTTVSFKADFELRLVEGKLLPPDIAIHKHQDSSKPVLYFINETYFEDGVSTEFHWKPLRPKDEIEATDIPAHYPDFYIPPPPGDSVYALMGDKDATIHQAIIRLWHIIYDQKGENVNTLRLSEDGTPLHIQSENVMMALVFLFFSKDGLIEELDASHVTFSPECWDVLTSYSNLFHSLETISCIRGEIDDLGPWLPLASFNFDLDLRHNHISDLLPLVSRYQGVFVPTLDVRHNHLSTDAIIAFVDELLTSRTTPCYNHASLWLESQLGRKFTSEEAVQIGPKLTLLGIQNDLMWYMPTDHGIENIPLDISNAISEIILSEIIGNTALKSINALLSKASNFPHCHWVVVHLLKRFFIFHQNSKTSNNLLLSLCRTPNWNEIEAFITKNWGTFSTTLIESPEQALQAIKDNPNQHSDFVIEVLSRLFQRPILLYDDHTLFEMDKGMLWPKDDPKHFLHSYPLNLYRNAQGEYFFLEYKQ